MRIGIINALFWREVEYYWSRELSSIRVRGWDRAFSGPSSARGAMVRSVLASRAAVAASGNGSALRGALDQEAAEQHGRDHRHGEGAGEREAQGERAREPAQGREGQEGAATGDDVVLTAQGSRMSRGITAIPNDRDIRLGCPTPDPSMKRAPVNAGTVP